MISTYPEGFTVAPFIWNSFIKDKGEEWARAFFRYTLLLEASKLKMTEEQLRQELINIKNILGDNISEMGKKRGRRYTRQVTERESLYMRASEYGDEELAELELYNIYINTSKARAKTYESILEGVQNERVNKGKG